MTGTIEILDTTLRDGEQTSGVSFNDEEKLTLAKILLEDLGVNRIEVASARVSQGELSASALCLCLVKVINSEVEVSDFVDRHID